MTWIEHFTPATLATAVILAVIIYPSDQYVINNSNKKGESVEQDDLNAVTLSVKYNNNHTFDSGSKPKHDIATVIQNTSLLSEDSADGSNDSIARNIFVAPKAPVADDLVVDKEPHVSPGESIVDAMTVDQKPLLSPAKPIGDVLIVAKEPLVLPQEPSVDALIVDKKLLASIDKPQNEDPLVINEETLTSSDEPKDVDALIIISENLTSYDSVPPNVTATTVERE